LPDHLLPDCPTPATFCLAVITLSVCRRCLAQVRNKSRKPRLSVITTALRPGLALLVLAAFVALFLPLDGWCQSLLPGITAAPAANGDTTYSLSIQTLLLLTPLCCS